jgi:hypothetical protein
MSQFPTDYDYGTLEYHDPNDPNNPTRSTQPVGGSQQGDQIWAGATPPTTPTSTAPTGTVGHNDSYNGQTREQWRDAWTSGGGTTDQWKAKASQMGAQWLADNGTIRTPWGEQYDGVIGLRDDGYGTGGWTAQGSGSGSGGGSGTSGGSGDSWSGSGTGDLGGMSGGAGGTLWDKLMSRMNQSLQIDKSDPIIANQLNAFDAAQTRSMRDYLAQEAEAAGPQGNINMETRMAHENRGQQSGQFMGALMQRELDARRQEIQQALNGALGYLTEQQRMALTKQLADMDNALAYANLGQRGYEFDVNDEFRRSPLAG